MYESFNPSDTDLTPQLGKIKAADVQSIICWTVTPAGVVFLKQAQQLGMDQMNLIHSYGFVDKRYMDLAGDAAKNLLLVSVKFPVGAQLPDSDPQKSRIAALTQSFEAKYKRKPNQFAAQTYDAIYLARTAIERAGGADRTKVRDALTALPTARRRRHLQLQCAAPLRPVEGRPGAAEIFRRRVPACRLQVTQPGAIP
jgi:branched-chain amino acid transport system substrate-binding protein